ncbi:MAG: phosphotransferase [Ruminococcaceae bacterium]|nr:phosphotransferase [Oscillospiraceae bacterium]
MAKEILKQDLGTVAKLLSIAPGKSDYTEIERMGGLTNRTYKVSFADGSEYAVRIPGEGTEELICRKNEQKSTELACNLGIDAELLYFGENGDKVSLLISNADTMSADTMKNPLHIKKAADVLRRLHKSAVDTGVPFEVFSMASGYEKIINDKNVPMFSDYEAVKVKVMEIKSEIDATCNTENAPCHNDPLCENWVMSGSERMYLIDWEYAGMNDGFWDLAAVSIEAVYKKQHDELLLSEYLQREPTDADMRHLLANKIYVDFLWTLWAKARVPYDGQPMEDWAQERFERLKGFIAELDAL